MGNTLKTKLFILSGIFLITSFFIYSVKDPVLHNKPSLKQHFQTIENYRTIQHIPLSGENLKMLKLDDYLYADFKGPDGIVNLYIGYYYTSNKAYASHSPLVCYPSHGWEITRHPTKHSTDVADVRESGCQHSFHCVLGGGMQPGLAAPERRACLDAVDIGIRDGRPREVWHIDLQNTSLPEKAPGSLHHLRAPSRDIDTGSRRP